jgi:hypothetical protein
LAFSKRHLAFPERAMANSWRSLAIGEREVGSASALVASRDDSRGVRAPG